MMQQHSGKPFRKAAQTFLITIPHLEVPAKELMEEFKRREPLADEIVVCRELHADGTPHMHAYLHFKRTMNVKDPFRWDFMGKHCNIRTMRRGEDARDYVCKGDDHVEWHEEPPSSGLFPIVGRSCEKGGAAAGDDDPSLPPLGDKGKEKRRHQRKRGAKAKDSSCRRRNDNDAAEEDNDNGNTSTTKKRRMSRRGVGKKKKPLTQIDKTILHFQEGGTIDDMDAELWGFVMMHKPKIEAFQQHFERITRTDDVAQRRGEVSFVVPSMAVAEGVERRVEQVVRFPVVDERPFKSKQWWIWGTTNVGKSTIKEKLLSELKLSGFTMPKDTNFQAWNDKAYHFAYIDEYKGHHSIQFLNEWLEGARMQLDVKYGHRDKGVNIPTIILSNFPPEKVYPDAQPEEMNALLGRLNVIHMVDHAHDFEFHLKQ